MTQHTIRRLATWSVPTLLIAGVLVFAFRPRAVPVDFVAISTGALEESVTEDGQTRVRDIYTIAAPISGRLLRTPLEVGDSLVQGETVVAQIEPSDPDFLNPRALAEAEAAVAAADAAHRLSQAELERARADHDFAQTEAGRAHRLFANGTVPRQFVDEADHTFRAAEAAARAAEAAVDVKAREVVAARARLIMPSAGGPGASPCACADITAPVSGRVLRVFEASETVVAAGTPLLETGDPANIEIVSDFLSTDAVRIQPGMPTIVEGWGGAQPLSAVVKRIEPVGHTRTSALGIDEQRVNVIFDITSPRQDWTALGHGFRVDTRVVLWANDNVDRLPQTALFRTGDTWSVFVEDDGVARERPVTVGHRSGLRVEILDGLKPGDRVVLHPGAHIEDGVRVAQRD